MSDEQTHYIHHLLANNDPPFPADMPPVMACIQDLESAIISVKGKISSWTSRLHDLEQQLNQHRGVISAMRRMPEEILGQIFLVYPFAQKYTAPMDRDDRNELVQLMLVCKPWCDAALATHGLWGTIALDGKDCRRLSYDKVVAWLARAGSVPRGLHISMRQAEDCPSLCRLAPSLTVKSSCRLNTSASLIRLLSEGPHFKTLDVTVQHRRCLERFMSVVGMRQGQNNGPQNLLKSLRLVIMDEDRPADLSFLSYFSSLTSIDLAGTRSLGSLAQADDLFGRLKALKFFYGVEPAHDKFATLARCVNLEELGIVVLAGPSGFDGIICLPRLIRLQVHAVLSSHSPGPLEILNHLELPSLEIFEVHASPLDSNNACGRFFKRHPQIKRLTGKHLIGQGLEAIFTDLPSLTHLTLFGAYNALAYFQSHSKTWLSAPHEYLLPRLQRLEMREVHPQADLRPLLHVFLHRIREGGSRTLKGVTIGYMGKAGVALSETGTGASVHSETVRLLGMEGVKVNENFYRTRDRGSDSMSFSNPAS